MTFKAPSTTTLNILVAGGAGFVGAHLVRTLRTLNHRVLVLDNQLTGDFSALDGIPVELVDGDVTRELDLVGLGQFHVVVHLASPASPKDYTAYPVETWRANSVGTENLLSLCASQGARFVFASTSEVYGDPLFHPQSEEYRGNVDPTGPRAMYDESKRFGEMLVSQYRELFEVKAAIVRIFNAYGPGMRLNDGRVVPSFVSNALAGHDLVVNGDGTQTRSMTYISDLISAITLIVQDPASDGLVLNIGSTEEITMRNLAELVLGIAGSPSGIVQGVARPDDPQQRRPDTSRIYARYRWAATVPLEVGLKRTIEWARTKEAIRA
jgi:nucleoside-diphosphate-sugar epimerase